MSEVQVIQGTEVAQSTGPTTQVYKATHKGDGSRLPFMNRSFISFSYGGKYIEDFNLLVVIDGDRLQRNVYADFSDNVSESDILDEQIFWSSHFNGNQLSLTLATDEMTENEMEAFKQWFKPGTVRDLILSEHPSRAIRARVGSVPEYSMIPFEKETEVKIGGLIYKTSTTIYRGEISLQFTMEEPYWHSISNVMCYKEDSDPVDYDSWLSAQGIPAYIYGDPDAIKVVLEDNLPLNAMLKYADLLIGNNTVISSTNITDSQVDESEIDSGRVGPLLEETTGLTFNSGAANAQFFYYGGSAPAKPIISFTLTPTLDNEGYINSPFNSFTGTTAYNTITIESQNKKYFKFTTPGIWTGYNQAIKILKSMNNQPLEEVRRRLREGVNHYAPRAYAVAVVCSGDGEQRLVSDTAVTTMQNFLCNLASASFSINCKTGISLGTFTYKNTSNENITSEEEVGDMIKSNYLIIEEQNKFSDDGYVEKWTAEHPEYSHKIYHDVTNGIANLLLTYDYMYY